MAFYANNGITNLGGFYTNGSSAFAITVPGGVGGMSFSSTAALMELPFGYITGSGLGASYTQTTSRTTTVPVTKVCGQITLFTAAGSATPATFSVTGAGNAAVDCIKVWCISSTNVYETFVTAVGSSTFNITFLTTGGVVSDAPVFGYQVVKSAIN
jgi:hypothetical protein